MKQRIVFLFFSMILLASVPVKAQSMGPGGPMRKVLFTMQPREELFYGEFICNFNLKEGRWACYVVDTLTQRVTFVWNGERKEDAGVFNYIDLNRYESSIQYYSTDRGEYIRTSEGLFGPYYSVYSTISSDNDVDYKGKRFVYKRSEDGDAYVHDQDGKEYRMEDGRTEFRSANGKHWAELLQGGRRLMIDGLAFELPLPYNAKMNRSYPTDLFLFDNGSCYYNVHMLVDDKWKDMELFISGGDIRVLRESESFDFISKDVRARNSASRRSYFFHESFASSFTHTNQYGEEEEWYGYRLRDRSGKHEFLSTWDKNYVEIDGKAYGKQSPILAYFDYKDNAFVWIVVEGRQLVQYSIKFSV